MLIGHITNSSHDWRKERTNGRSFCRQPPRDIYCYAYKSSHDSLELWCIMNNESTTENNLSQSCLAVCIKSLLVRLILPI